jgi:hypothetical protein
MLHYRHFVGSRRHVRVVDCDLDTVFAELAGRQGAVPLMALPDADGGQDDERAAAFLAALARARTTDPEYLARVQALDALGREEDAAVAELDRWLRDHVRATLGWPSLPDRAPRDAAQEARRHGIAPAYDLPPAAENSRPLSGLQTLFPTDDLGSRLARIAADAALAEQETGLSTLFLAFGFLRWQADDDVPGLAPLLLLPVGLTTTLEEGRAVWRVHAAAEYPETNLSLREVLAGAVPGRILPEFDEDSDGIESYLAKVAGAIAGLERWGIARYLTLGHFPASRAAIHADLAADKWPSHPASHALVQGLLRGSSGENSGVNFAADYDLDDEAIEDVAPILIEDADASQHSAIVDAMKGRNLVIEGAPGTGKSQTIANIVANALYAGKTVLILANKLTALQAVKRRMDTAGLGDFCLDLHSDRVQAKSTLLGLQQRYEMGRDRGYEPAWAIDLRKLRKARSRLRDYLAALQAGDGRDHRTAFELIWAAIAGRREYAREFASVHRIDLSEVFGGAPDKIAADTESLRLFATAVATYEQHHGSFAQAAWTKAEFAPGADLEPRMVADLVREAHEAAVRLIEVVAARSAKLQIELPRIPSRLSEWIEAARRLPPVPDDTLLARVASFAPEEIIAAADLAAQQLAAEDRSAEAERKADPVAIGYLVEQAQACGVTAALPAEVIARAGKMMAHKASLIEGCTKMSALIAAFGTASDPDLAAARAIAEAIEFAAVIPPQLDPFLGFDGTGREDLLSDGAQRVRLLAETERTLDQKFRRDAHGEWPPIEELKVAASVASATGLWPLTRLVTGQRKRANLVFQTLGVSADTSDLQSDIETLIFHLEARQRLRSDKRLAAAAGPFWAELATPFDQLVAVTRVRAAFEARIAGLGEIGQMLKSHLFSSNARIVGTLRSYRPWLAQLRADLDAWPESFGGIALQQAVAWIEDRTTRLGQLADGVRELGLADVEASFDLLREHADGRVRLVELTGKIAANAVLARVGEAVWQSPRGSEALREAGLLSQAIAAANPPPGIRARLTVAEGPSFARLLDGSIVAIGLAVERYRREAARLAAAAGIGLDADGGDPEQVAGSLAPLLPELASLGPWLEVAHRRARAAARGLDPMIAAFEEAGLSFQRLAGAFTALEVFYRAVLLRRRHPALQSFKGAEADGERELFAVTDHTFQQRQREAVRIKLLGNAIPSGTCAGRKKDWTELHFIRNELAKAARHATTRTLLARSRRAVLAMKPCVMASPLSLASFMPRQPMCFDLLVIDEASQMTPEDALGGMLRARQVVVVGDRNQLPASDVFRRIAPAGEFGAEREDDDGIAPGSLLDWALASDPAPRRLASHYRSRCESLIAFSNREFYGGKLATVPNVRPGGFAIDLVRVDGTFAAGCNPAEVARIVEAATAFIREHSDALPEQIPTLCIAAMTREQRDAICEEFYRAAQDPAVARYLAACAVPTPARGPEPFFIKEIENLQGDARDVVMISLTYGAGAEQTPWAQSFGSLSRNDGHRRVNVLSTLARQRVVLFSSLRSEDLLVHARSRGGVQALRDYLRDVETRGSEAAGGLTESTDDFRRELRARLEAYGFSADPKAGAAAFGVDLAVRHPRDPAAYLAAIESDGPAFQGVRSARERDRLREAALAARGWTTLRLWSADWFANPQNQTERLVEALTRLVEPPPAADAGSAPSDEKGGGHLAAEATGVANAPAPLSSAPQQQNAPAE